jgi:hypothetical protein
MTAAIRKLAILGVLGVAMQTNVLAQAGYWKDGSGNLVQESESRKSKNDFAGAIIATTDEDWRAKWDTSPETKPSFTKAETVPYGKKVFILTLFSNPALDPAGKASIRCDIKIQSPAGSVVLEQNDQICYAGPIRGGQFNLRLSAPVIAFSGDPGDAPGTWSVMVNLRDTLRKVELPLRTSFILK